jgi:1-acyl-sn-glycerol-3-phosphate acyltransferase
LSAPRLASPPPSAPVTHNAFGRWLGRTVLRLGGWNMVGEWPDVPKLVILAAPHSSAWDALWGLAAKLAMGLRVDFMAKRELFWWPLGWLLRTLGAVPTDRRAAHGIVGASVARLRDNPKSWLVIAPEGTRRRVERWKSGFWRIARGANVPVCCVYFHYPEKHIGVGEVFTMTDDLDADMARIRTFYRPWIGKNRGTT